MSGGVTPQQRRITLAGISAGSLATAALWFALLTFLPPPATANAFVAALACSAIAALLTLVAGVEAVAHERLITPAIDPLAGAESQRMRSISAIFPIRLSSLSASPPDCCSFPSTLRHGRW